MSPKDLAQVLCHLPIFTDANVLVGLNTSDDAGVYKVNDDFAIVFTVDYFTPVVNDPYDFGAIAATNAFSDCYAMGVRPCVALNIVGFPIRTLPAEVLNRILEGGSDKAREAGVSIIGGHTIEDAEPKYGMAVAGFAHPDAIITNSGAQEGDMLILTKPLGIGILTTGIKGSITSEKGESKAIEVMKTLNAEASAIMTQVGANACTDITGFGLLGHLYEMCVASKVGAEIRLSDVPVLGEAWELAKTGIIPAGAYANKEHVSAYVTFAEGIGEIPQIVLCDPQTSGGLLISVSSDKVGTMVSKFSQVGIQGAVIGGITSREAGCIVVVE